MQSVTIQDETIDKPMPDCPICYLPIQKHDLCELPCTHMYHIECIRKNYSAMGKQRVCPYCRTPYPKHPISVGFGSEIIVGDTVSFTAKIKQKNVQLVGKVEKIMPNTVQIVGDGFKKRVDKHCIIKV